MKILPIVKEYFEPLTRLWRKIDPPTPSRRLSSLTPCRCGREAWCQGATLDSVYCGGCGAFYLIGYGIDRPVAEWITYGRRPDA